VKPTPEPGAVETSPGFVYAVRQRAGDLPDLRGPFQAVVFGGVVYALFAWLGARKAALVAGLMVFAGAVVWQSVRRSRRASGVVLRVENGMLRVYPPHAPPAAPVPLADVHDVVLDTKMLRKPQRSGRRGAPGMRSLEVDVARITLVLSPEVAPIELTSEYGAHSETVEQIAKMKMFLRSRGWLPLDERP